MGIIDASMALFLLIVCVVIFVILCVIEDLICNDNSQILEYKCRNCTRYYTCKDHGSIYNCDKFIAKYDPKKGGKTK